MKFCISISGKDRPGIVAAVTEVLYRHRGNLEDASMTILETEFTMMLLASFKQSITRSRLLNDLKRLEQKAKLHIHVTPVFPAPRRPAATKARRVVPHIISIFGKDRAGIVYKVTRLLADHRLNITDLNSKLIQSGKKPVYGLLIEVEIPQSFQMPAFTTKLNRTARSLGVDLSIKPVESLPL